MPTENSVGSLWSPAQFVTLRKSVILIDDGALTTRTWGDVVDDFKPAGANGNVGVFGDPDSNVEPANAYQALGI